MGAELKLLSRSGEATFELGRLLGRAAPPGLVVALDGELGTGKTTLVRGLAEGLEVQDPVSSPTYTLMNSYRGRLELLHFDAWMEGRETAFLDGGGAEWFHSGGVAVVEWGQRVQAFLPADRLEVVLLHRGTLAFDEDGQLESDREVRLKALGEVSSALLEQLPARLGATRGLEIIR